MRAIPALSVLCLRVVGSSRCSAEETFAKVPEKQKDKKKKDGAKKEDEETEEKTEPPAAADAAAAAAAAVGPNQKELATDLVSVPTPPRRTSVVLPVEIVKRVPSTASQLLEAFHRRGTNDDNNNSANDVDAIPIDRMPIFSARRRNANDIDLNHPWIAVYPASEAEEVGKHGGHGLPPVPAHFNTEALVAEYSSPALDVLQSYVDALVEMGRMDDGRLGLHFFQEFKTGIELSKSPLGIDAEAVEEQRDEEGSIESEQHEASTKDNDDDDDDQSMEEEGERTVSPPSSNRKKRTKKNPYGASKWKRRKKMLEQKKAKEQMAAMLAAIPTSVASLSLHNAVILDETLQALVDSRVLPHIAVLDLTGIATLTDDMLLTILSRAGCNLQRLSLKNCRRLTNTSLTNLVDCCSKHLSSLDIGGTYNMTPGAVLKAISPNTIRKGRWPYPVTPLPHLVELHASGLNWQDSHLEPLFAVRAWRGLSLGFSELLTFEGFKEALLEDSSYDMRSTLQSLALPFCENLVSNSLLGFMGRHLPHVRAMDVRGNNLLTSMTGWYDGRATIRDGTLAPLNQSLVVLARYSGITKISLENTMQDVPEAASSLTVVLDSEGVGLGILRIQSENPTTTIATDAKETTDSQSEGDVEMEKEA